MTGIFLGSYKKNLQKKPGPFGNSRRAPRGATYRPPGKPARQKNQPPRRPSGKIAALRWRCVSQPPTTKFSPPTPLSPPQTGRPQKKPDKSATVRRVNNAALSQQGQGAPRVLSRGKTRGKCLFPPSLSSPRSRPLRPLSRSAVVRLRLARSQVRASRDVFLVLSRARDTWPVKRSSFFSDHRGLPRTASNAPDRRLLATTDLLEKHENGISRLFFFPSVGPCQSGTPFAVVRVLAVVAAGDSNAHSFCSRKRRKAARTRGRTGTLTR